MEVRKIFFKLLVCLSILVCTFPCEAAKKTVAIMPLECASNINKGSVADVMTEQLLIAVKESGIYSVVERNQLDSVMKEQGFQTLVRKIVRREVCSYRQGYNVEHCRSRQKNCTSKNNRFV